MTYAEKIEAKKELYAQRAAKAREEASQIFDQTAALGRVMAGTPILVGHHSENKHRRDLARVDAKISKAIELNKKAEYYDGKIKVIEAGKVISSDDENARQKIEAKIAKIDSEKERMKTANKIIRNVKIDTDTKRAQLLAMYDNSQLMVDTLLTPVYGDVLGFSTEQISAKTAEIRRLKGRLAEMDTAETLKFTATVGDTQFVTGEDRFEIYFAGKPDEATRALLKSKGFRYSPTKQAWQCYKTNRGLWSVQQVAKQLQEEYN